MFVQSFRDSLNHYDQSAIHKLIIDSKTYKIQELKSFSTYLHQDIQAILSSIHYTFSNGNIEGQMNRLKTIKRMLYGRASLELLKKRVLYCC
ncbi:transposase [Schinkia azotoformans]|uniref:transposase n=1 Tax=Schinkia azotoformans TaxID=1454 RepID=UPI00399D6F99